MFLTMYYILKNKKQYNIYLKLHTKKSLLSNDSDISTWRKELIVPICGTIKNVSNCINLLKLDNIGMVGSIKWIREITYDNNYTRNNKDIIESYIKIFKWESDYAEFIGGTMFWVNGKIWEAFFSNINIEMIYELFMSGKVTDDNIGTHEHTFERLFGKLISENKLKILGI